MGPSRENTSMNTSLRMPFGISAKVINCGDGNLSDIAHFTTFAATCENDQALTFKSIDYATFTDG
jgi:hypothetical protein